MEKSKSPSTLSRAEERDVGLLDDRSVPRTKARGLSNTSTLSIEIPEELRKQLELSGISLSVLIRLLLKNLKEEKEMVDWSVKLQRSARKGRYVELEKKGLV